MNLSAHISPLSWQMSRLPLVVHLGAIAACVPAFMLTNSATPWLWTIALIILLPISQSMRLNRLGRSPFWPALPMIGVILIVLQLLAGIASVSGAPDGTMSDSEKLVTAFGVISLCLIALITLICLMPARWVARALPEGDA